ncbi:MAG: NUDIX domain-containing protein [Bacteroidetes bacterium]|nr:NUDIX domain-containing protein [Bacteroidota bacterium]
MKDKSFNIRIYGLLIKDGKILVTDEFRLGIPMTKFPGGGLQFGEGPVDCLRREFREELNMEIKEPVHFYTTEFFQPTELLPSNRQLISIYYLVEPVDKEVVIRVTEKRFDFEYIDGAQTFRWVALSILDKEEFTFPVDRLVAGKILHMSSTPHSPSPERRRDQGDGTTTSYE